MLHCDYQILKADRTPPHPQIGLKFKWNIKENRDIRESCNLLGQKC